MLDRQKHEIVLRNLLRDFYKSPYLATRLGFKGGTAAYIFYELPRFSVDLDFDLLIKNPELDDINNVHEAIQTICARHGQVVESRVKNYTIFCLIRYQPNTQAIKIEISKRLSLCTYKPLSMFGVSVNTMVKEDIFANKLVALTARKAPAARDLFDINYFFSKLWDINGEIINDRTGKKIPEYLKDVKKYIIKNFNKTNVLAGLGELLDKKDKGKMKVVLIEDTLFKIDNYLKTLQNNI